MGKGVSAAEKKQRMVQMFHAECAVYTAKEVQKAAPKTGIVSGAVEGVLKELIGDDIVHEAKLSGMLFYWSFPGYAAVHMDESSTAITLIAMPGLNRDCREVATKKRAELASQRATVNRMHQQVPAWIDSIASPRPAPTCNSRVLRCAIMLCAVGGSQARVGTPAKGSRAE